MQKHVQEQGNTGGGGGGGGMILYISIELQSANTLL